MDNAIEINQQKARSLIVNVGVIMGNQTLPQLFPLLPIRGSINGIEEALMWRISSVIDRESDVLIGLIINMNLGPLGIPIGPDTTEYPLPRTRVWEVWVPYMKLTKWEAATTLELVSSKITTSDWCSEMISNIMDLRENPEAPLTFQQSTFIFNIVRVGWEITLSWNSFYDVDRGCWSLGPPNLQQCYPFL